VWDWQASSPGPGMEERVDPMFSGWDRIKRLQKGNWHEIVWQGLAGEKDVVAGIKENVQTWQTQLDEFWESVE